MRISREGVDARPGKLCNRIPRRIMLTTIIILVVLGVLSIGLEFFLPGGILGIVGIVVLAASIVLCFTTYGAAVGMGVAAGVVIFVVLALTFWLKYFDKFGPGKDFMLGEAVKNDSREESMASLLNAEGVAKTDLRPAGKAQVDGRRLDVVAESGMIDEGSAVKVVKVEGMRIVVRALTDSAVA